jgi:DNA polymerase-3 subunit delta
MLLSHDLESLGADDREQEIANAMVGAQTGSLFGGDRVVVLRGIGEATVDQLKPLVAYLAQPLEDTQLVLTGSGKLAKSITDALKQAGATTINTSPPSRFNELSMWFQEQLTEAGLKVDSGGLKMLIEWLGQDQARLPSIIEVLVSTYGTNKKLTVEEIEPFLGQEGSVMPWDLTDAIDLSNSPKAIAMLRRMIRRRQRPRRGTDNGNLGGKIESHGRRTATCKNGRKIYFAALIFFIRRLFLRAA